MNLPKTQNEMAKAALERMEVISYMLPTGVHATAFAIACISELNRLDKCDVASAVGTVYNAATVGLIPGQALGHCYFVPYKIKGVKRCQLVIGYRGFIELAMASDFLRDVHSDVILTDEKWRHWKDETGPRLEHEVPIDRPLPTDKNIIGSYAIYHSRDGGRGIKVLTRKQIDAVDTDQNVWASQHYPEMCMKSAVRRASKEWRLSSRLAVAVRLDEQSEAGQEQDYLEVTTETNTPRFSLAAVPEVKE